MTRHAYPGAAMRGDYLRAAAGLAPSLLILALAPPGPVGTVILAGLAALFAVFGVRTALRHHTIVEMSETGLLASGPLAAAIPWADLDRVKLAYYSVRRDRSDGWMQLELRAGRSVLRLDSRIDGFARLVERATVAAAVRHLVLSTATAANIEALGIELRAVPSTEAAIGVGA